MADHIVMVHIRGVTAPEVQACGLHCTACDAVDVVRMGANGTQLAVSDFFARHTAPYHVENALRLRRAALTADAECDDPGCHGECRTPAHTDGLDEEPAAARADTREES